MSEFPPPDIVREKLLFAVLPAAVATAAVFAVGLLLAWGLVGRYYGTTGGRRRRVWPCWRWRRGWRPAR